MNKKLISLILALLIIFSQFVSLSTVTFGDEIESDDFIIQNNVLLGLSNKKKEEVMSSHSLILPEGVLELGPHALQGLGLESITFNSDLQKLNEYALTDNNLTSVNFPNSLIEIADFALRDNKLTSLDTNKVSKIGKGAFQNNKIDNVQIRSDVSSIEDEAFRGNNLTEINIPENILLFGSRVFTDNGRYVRILGNNPVILTEKVPGHYGHICNSAIVTVRFLDKETKSEIIEPKIIGNDFSVDGGLVLEKYKETEYALPKISGYIPAKEKITLQPDTDNSEVVAYYISTNTPPSFKLVEKRFKAGSKIDSSALIRGIEAYDFQGKDISNKITVTPESLDSEVVGTFTVTYSVTDDFGNIGFKETEVKIFSDFENYEIGNGWVVGDFAFRKDMVIGFSAKGKEKVKTNKDLVIPNINLEGADVKTIQAGRSRDFQKKKLKSVKILEGITTIKGHDFKYNNIDTLLLPDSIQRIGSLAFANNKITSFNVKKLPKIYNEAFLDNSNKAIIVNSELDGVNIQSSNRTILCNPMNIAISDVEDDTVFWEDEDFIWDGNKILRLSDSGVEKLERANKLVIPERCRIIGEYAFNDLGLTNVVLNEELEVIEKSAFCKNKIKEIIIPNNVSEIEHGAFSANQLDKSTVAHREHFGANYYDSKVGLLYNPIKSSGDSDGVFDEDDFTWRGTTITGLTKNGEKKLSETSSLVIPEKATSIGKAVFKGIGLTSVILPERLKRIENNAFEDNKITSLVIPDNVEFIGDNAFLNNTINKITLGSSLKEIGVASFSNNKIENLVLPFSLSVISSSAFKDNSIKTIDLGENIKKIGESAFYGNKVENLYMPDSVVEIGICAFSNNALKELKLGKNVISIGKLAFYGNKIEHLKLNNLLKSIGEKAFMDNLIKELDIPDSVTSLADFAFQNNEIEKLTIGKGLNTINESVFENNKLVDVKIPDNIICIEKSAFQNNNIKNLILGNFIKDIRVAAFAQNNLVAVYIPESIQYIDSSAFYNNQNDSSHPTKMFLYIVDKNGKLVNKIQEDWYYDYKGSYNKSVLINPIIVNVKYIDENGKELLKGYNKIIVDSPSYTERNIEYIDGYILPKPVTIDISTGDVEYNLNVVYKKADKKYKDTLANNSRILGIKHETEKEEYQIGAKMISLLNFNIDASVGKLERYKIKLFFNPEYYSYEDINIPSSVEILDFKKEKNFVEISFSQLYGGKVVKLPISWMFKKLTTPSNTKHIIQGYVLNEKNEMIASVNDIYFKGTYEEPRAYPNLLANGFSCRRYNTGTFYFTMLDNGESGLPDTCTISYSFNVYVSRKSKGYKLECPLPEYTNSEGKILKAVFSEKDNPGWILSKDGKTVMYEDLDTPSLKNDSSFSTVKLNLNYPGLKKQDTVKLKAKISICPLNKSETEPLMMTYSEASFNYETYTKSDETPKGGVIPIPLINLRGSMKDYYNINRNDNNIEMEKYPRYLFDKSFLKTSDFRESIFTWKLFERYIDKNKNSLLTIRDMDKRLYYYSIIPTQYFKNAVMRAYDINKNVIFTRKIIDTDEIIFPGKVARNIEYIDFEIPSKSNNSPDTYNFDAILTVKTKLKTDNNALYNHWDDFLDYNSSTSFKAKAVLTQISGSEDVVLTATDSVELKVSKSRISADQYIGFDEENNLLSTDSNITFTPRFNCNDNQISFFAKDFQAISLLPKHVIVKSVTINPKLSPKGNIAYKVIENYKNSGRTAVLFKIDSILFKSNNKNTRSIRGDSIAEIEAFLDGEIKNETLDSYVAITAESGVDIYKNINDEDRKFLGGDNWSKSIKPIRTFAVESLIFKEYIKQKNSLSSLDYSKLELGEDFEYVLNIFNKTNEERKNISIISVLPNPNTKRLSPDLNEFKPVFDYIKGVSVPDGYSVYYLNTPFPDTGEAIDKIDSSIQWDKSPSKYTSAIKVVSNPGVALQGQSSVKFGIPMSIPDDPSVTGKKAYHFSFYMDNISRDYSKSNKVTIEPIPLLASIRFRKVGYDSNFAVLEPLEGVVFELRYPDGTLAKTAVSNKYGLVYFGNIDASKDYYLQETHAPDDFYKDESKIYISSQDLLKAPDRLYKLKDIANKRKATPLEFISGSLEFTKVNKSGAPLNQAEFTLTGVSNWNKDIKLVEKSNKNGKVSFKNVPYGKYVLTESNPPGSLMPIEPRSINILPQNLHLDLGAVVNDKAAVKVVKVRVDKQPFGVPPHRFKDIHGDKLPNVKFNLYNGSQLINNNLITNENGELTIGNLELNTVYTIKEQEAPKGYSKVYNEIQFKVNENGELLNEKGRRFLEPYIYVPNLIDANIDIVKIETSEETADLPLNRLTGLEGKPLEGVLFDLYEGEILCRQGLTTDSDGKINLTGLKYDTRYTLKEVKPLDRYVIINSEIPFILKKNGDRVLFKDEKLNGNTLYIPNVKKKTTSSVVVKKTDGITGESLEGAEFKLIRIRPSGESIYSTKVTNKDGIAEFNDVISGSYKLIESKAPNGYVADGKVESFVADAYNSKVFNFEYTNKPLKLNLRKASYIARGLKKQEAVDLSKTDKSYVVGPNKMLYDVYKPLAGAKFKVINASTGEFIEEAISDNEGNLNLNPKLYNTSSTYKIIELKAPDGYEPNTFGWYVALSALQRQGINDDGVNIILNNTPSKGKIIVSKYDKNIQKIIKDVEFTLYDKNGDKIVSARTDDNGIAQFSDLSLGVYYVAETEAAPGYVQSEEREKIEITNTNLTVVKVLYNEKKIKPSVLPTTGLNNELYITSIIFCLIALALSLRKKKSYI